MAAKKLPTGYINRNMVPRRREVMERGCRPQPLLGSTQGRVLRDLDSLEFGLLICPSLPTLTPLELTPQMERQASWRPSFACSTPL